MISAQNIDARQASAYCLSLASHKYLLALRYSLCEKTCAMRTSLAPSSSLSSNDPSPGRDYVTALARGLEVINAFSSDAPEMTLSEIAARTAINAATVRRSLITLEHLGYIRRRGRKFLLAPKVLSLGASYFQSMNLGEVAQTHLAALVERFRDASSLTVLDGFEVLYVAHVASEQRVPHSRNVGTRLPAYATSTGLVLLAHSSTKHQEKLLGMELSAFTSRTPVKPADLRRLLAKTRKDDYAIARDTLDYGSIALAVPVRIARGTVVAAVNCSARTDAVGEAQMIRSRLAPLRDAAAKIGEMIDRYPALVHSLSDY